MPAAGLWNTFARTYERSNLMSQALAACTATLSVEKVSRRAVRTHSLVAATFVATLACGGPGAGNTPDATGPGSTGSSESSRSDQSQDAQRPVITIKGFAFITPSSVAPGEKVTIKNADAVTHTFTAHGDSGFDITVEAGQSVTFVPPHAAGRYDLLCNLHPSMSGTLTVR